MAYTPPPTTPPIPQRGDRATFSNRVDAFLMWVAQIIPWMQGFLQQLTTLAVGGANSFTYNFDSATADSDPGAGMLRLNNATQNLATVLRIDPISAGTDITGVIAALVARTSAIKGTIRIQRFNDLTEWMIFDVLGFTANAGYYNLNVATRASTSDNPFNAGDQVVVFIEPSGERGESGIVGYVKISDKKPNGTTGGVAAAGVNNRTLNTIDVSDISGVTLNNSIFTLPAGSYDVQVRCPSFAGGAVMAQLLNIDDNITFYGSSLTSSGTSVSIDSTLFCKFSIQAPKTFRIQHYIGTSSSSTNTLGASAASGRPGIMETYTEVVIRRIG